MARRDRGDIEDYYKDIVIEFEEAPNKVVKSILMDIVPDLTIHNDSKVLSIIIMKRKLLVGMDAVMIGKIMKIIRIACW